MTNLTKTAVLAISLSLLSASFLLPSAIAQTETTTAAPAATTAATAPAKKKAARKKRAKLKKQASQIIEKGVEKANANVTK
ncbi:hypothetical protein BH10CYA1_BH10CYA1_14250 [soil metagenome]